MHNTANIQEKHGTVKEAIDKIYISTIEIAGIIEKRLSKNQKTVINSFDTFFILFVDLFRLTRNDKRLAQVMTSLSETEMPLDDAIYDWILKVRNGERTLKNIEKGLTLFDEYITALNNCGIITRSGV
jgi:hypothetical protein